MLISLNEFYKISLITLTEYTILSKLYNTKYKSNLKNKNKVMTKQPPENLENKIRNKLGPLQSLVELTKFSLNPSSDGSKPTDWSKYINNKLVEKCQRSIDQIIMIARIGDEEIGNPDFDVNEHL